MLYLCPISIDKREAHTAELSTLTTIGTALETMLRGIADARVTYTQCTMNKHLELYIRHLAMNLSYLLC